MSLLYTLIEYLHNTSGSCTVYGSAGTYTGSATISVSGDTINLLCNFTPDANDTVTGADFNFSTCLGELTHSASFNRPVAAGLAHVVVVTIRVSRV